ncbi:MAG: OmpA family protein [Saprospiraceae bacterium]|nr:OmpA family protein [Saprospiraceae bacterium]
MEGQHSFYPQNIFYDFDKWDITEKAAVELERLISFLEDNVNISIELSSHTDSRGNDPYNMDLSSKRAKSAVEYLVLRGMDPERLVAKGYGETKPVNNCRNGIECTEDKHSENRRTEIKILSQ